MLGYRKISTKKDLLDQVVEKDLPYYILENDLPHQVIEKIYQKESIMLPKMIYHG